MIVKLVITSAEGRKSMMKLAERMVISFCAGVGASTAHAWTTLSGTGCDDVRVMTRKSMDDPGRPPGIVLSAATSFWLPVPPNTVFNFLRHENSRSQVHHLSTPILKVKGSTPVGLTTVILQCETRSHSFSTLLKLYVLSFRFTLQAKGVFVLSYLDHRTSHALWVVSE